MEEYSLPLTISALGNLIATNTSSDEELAVLAAFLTQLGDTLATILTLRAFNEASSSLNKD